MRLDDEAPFFYVSLSVGGFVMPLVSLWWKALRPFTFTISLIPPLQGAVIALIDNPGLKLGFFRLILTGIGCMTAHAGANLLSDYYDYRKGVDREGTFGSSGVLVAGEMEPSRILKGGWAAMVMAGFIGAYLVYVTPGGVFLLGLVAIGGGFGVFYTAGPIRFKYRALGDLAVFFSFGPAMVLGAYYVQAHRFSWVPVLYSLPIGILVDAILHGNNVRDIADDKTVNIKTVPILIGESRARTMFYALVFGAYGTTLLLIGFTSLPLISLIVFFSLPLAVKVTKMMRRKDNLPLSEFAMIDAATARLHLAFGLLTVASLVVHFLTL
ncbi:MAG: 1,4-dihydroxy-2-naphthoate octaprenyltransferase [Deltaproteobacteria bacterium]|nr:1,4-dihydroxy-2-naphthoate octaprenyltransferase [Deltaproteobacteria bacterium]